MTDAEENDNEAEEARAQARMGMQAILDWVAAPPTARLSDELDALREHLSALSNSTASPPQRINALSQLYRRSVSLIGRLQPELIDARLPLPRKTRQLVRSLYDALQLLVAQLHPGFAHQEDAPIRGLRLPTDLILWRRLNILAHHLLINHLVAAPCSPGVWQQLHETYAMARRQGVENAIPIGEEYSLRRLYFSAVLQGCAQPAAFTSRESAFVAQYLRQYGDCIDELSEPPASLIGCFWIDLQRDAPAVAASRKPPPDGVDILQFSCNGLADLLRKQLAALEAGCSPAQIGLSEFAGRTAGKGVLKRLAGFVGKQAKRRFPRRRQGSRATLCSGLEQLWCLFRSEEALGESATSNWIITNESPDGYALMHVAGKTGNIEVGDITAVRNETDALWQVCIVRWVVSENPEHFELGLQIIAPRAVPAFLALPPVDNEGRQLPVLILPEIPPLRNTPLLVAGSDQIRDKKRPLTLVFDGENLEIREVMTTVVDEQTSSIEILQIQSSADGT